MLLSQNNVTLHFLTNKCQTFFHPACRLEPQLYLRLHLIAACMIVGRGSQTCSCRSSHNLKNVVLLSVINIYYYPIFDYNYNYWNLIFIILIVNVWGIKRKLTFWVVLLQILSFLSFLFWIYIIIFIIIL